MISANSSLPGSYDYGEVARSVLIAVAASYSALDLAGRVTAAKGRFAWLVGRWLSCDGHWHLGNATSRNDGPLLPVPVEYHWPTVLASLFVAILASAVALYVAAAKKWTRLSLTGSVIMGAGIAGMHYIGMASMRLPAVTHFSPLLGDMFHFSRNSYFL